MDKRKNNKQQAKIKLLHEAKIIQLHELSEEEKNHLKEHGFYIPAAKPTFWQNIKTQLASVPSLVKSVPSLVKNAISLKTLGQAVNASVLIGAITFIAGEQGRRDAQVYQAWQVINSAHNQPG
ncbi:hypothetical protein HW132_36190, partial [Brasilonema sp. CT11]|nr:hypothetical protein [Brasilonema sp. CT11]